MTTATVTHTIELPGGTQPTERPVALLRLIATTDGTDGFGHATGADVAVGGVRRARYDTNGTVTFTDVRPNTGTSSDVIDSPANTTYALTTRWHNHRDVTIYLSVPDSAGPHQAQDILAAAPTDLTDSAYLLRSLFDPDVERGQGRQHVDEAQGWLSGLAKIEAGTGNARVVLVSDSIGFLSAGFAQVASRLHNLYVDGDRPRSIWWPPRGAYGGWTTDEGDEISVGLDQLGTRLGDGETAGLSSAVAVKCSAVRVFYTAKTDGGTLNLYIDGSGSPAVTQDTSLDDDDQAVAAATAGQMVEVSGLDADTAHYFTITASASGGDSVDIEAVELVSGDYGIEWLGFGLSGQSSAEAVTADQVDQVLAAMANRGEDVDLVILASDTGDADTVTDTTTAITALVTAVRSHYGADVCSIAHYVPPAHNTNQATWSTYATAMRVLHRTLGLIPIDAYHALGDISTVQSPSDPKGYTSDGVHYSTKGQRAVEEVFLDALASRTVRPARTHADTAVDFTDGTHRQRVRDTTPELAALLDSAGGWGVRHDDRVDTFASALVYAGKLGTARLGGIAAGDGASEPPRFMYVKTPGVDDGVWITPDRVAVGDKPRTVATPYTVAAGTWGTDTDFGRTLICPSVAGTPFYVTLPTSAGWGLIDGRDELLLYNSGSGTVYIKTSLAMAGSRLVVAPDNNLAYRVPSKHTARIRFESTIWIVDVDQNLHTAQIASIADTTYTFDGDDDGAYLRFTSSSAVTASVPPHSTTPYPVGAPITVRQAGTGQVTIAAGAGVTINTAETLALRAQHSTATLLKVATDEWDLIGDLEAA